MILESHGLTKRFGGLTAVDGIDFQATSGHVTSIIGPNGAGKTTLLNMVSGVTPCDAGTLVFGGTPLTSGSQLFMAQHGLARTYQTPQLFHGMTVLETVMVGAHLSGRGGFFSALFRLRATQQQERALEARAHEALAEVGLDPALYGRIADQLAYGLQRRVEIARALAMNPKALLLDEPAAGLNTLETRDLSTLVRRLASAGLLVLLVEHDMDMVMGISDLVVVMNFGRRIAQGTPAAVQSEPAVIEAYLGVDLQDTPPGEEHARVT